MKLLATTVVRDSQMKLTRERSLQLLLLLLSYSFSLSQEVLQRRALARIMAVVEDEAKMRRRHYTLIVTGLRRGRMGWLVGSSSSYDSASGSAGFPPLSPPSACLAMTIAMQLTTMAAARETRAMQSAGRKCRPEAQPELEQHDEQEL